jgi:hypothetical protein
VSCQLALVEGIPEEWVLIYHQMVLELQVILASMYSIGTLYIAFPLIRNSSPGIEIL